jgi:GTP-binding protein
MFNRSVLGAALALILLSTLSDFPTLKDPQGRPLPEVALAGRSNVGKSSLINHLFGQKKLARISATPGKTQLLNFFCIDEKWILVDLPGYGFAKAPPAEVAKWSQAIDTYLQNRPSLKLLFLLIDSRRGPNEEDLAMVAWAKQKKIPLWMILTKTDKLSRSELEALLQKYPDAIPYSITATASKHRVQKTIEQSLWD